MRRSILLAPGFRFQAEQYLKELASFSREDYYDVSVLTGTPLSFWNEQVRSAIDKFTYVPLPSKVLSRLFGLRRIKSLDYGVYSQFLSLMYSRFDLLHLWAGFSSPSLLREFDGPLIIDRACPHILDQKQTLINEYARWGLHYNFDKRIIEKMLREYERADIILTPSLQTAASFWKRGFGSNKVKVYPLSGNFVSSRAYTEKSYRRDRYRFPLSKMVVGFVGGDVVRKGLTYLIDAVHMLDRKGCDVELYIKSMSITKKDFVVSRLEACGIRYKLFPDYEATLEPFFSSISCLVLPSVEEGYGMVVSEAISYNIPVLVSDQVGAISRHHDMPRDKFGVVPAFNFLELADSLESFMETGAFESSAYRFLDAELLTGMQATSYLALLEDL